MSITAVVAHLNGFAAQINGAFIFVAVDGEHVDLGDLAVILHVKDFIGIRIIDEVFDAPVVKVKSGQWGHANGAVGLVFVVIFNPRLREQVKMRY